MSEPDASAFVAALKRQFDDPAHLLTDRVEWVGGGVRADGSVVVFYREYNGGPVLGRRYVLSRFAAGFRPSVALEELAGIAIADDITDPTGSGKVLDVDWADGLVPEGTVVEWVGELYED